MSNRLHPNSASLRNSCLGSLLILSSLAHSQIPSPATKDVDELIELTLEQLVNVEVISASKYPQRQAEIPSTINVIGSDQIKGFGYRTLSDILNSLPGMFVSTDRSYDNLGVRGVSGANDFNGRILVMINGYRLNEAIFDSGTIGSEFPLDVDLIDRVEVIRGPASSVYGSNAFMGVVNVITKKGHDFKGGELAGAYGGFDGYKGRFSYGRKQDNGLEYLVSGSGFGTSGHNLYYPDLASSATNGGNTRNNSEEGQQIFTHLSYGHFTLMGGWGRRRNEVPGSLYGTNFNLPAFQDVDTHAFVQGQYQTALTDQINFTARAWHGDYSFDGVYPFGEIQNADTHHANWSGFELRLLSTNFQKQHITGGLEVQKNWTQLQTNFDLNPRVDYLHDNRNSLRVGVYLQDDIEVTEHLNLEAVLKFIKRILQGSI